MKFCLTPLRPTAASLPVASQHRLTSLANSVALALQASKNPKRVGNELATILHDVRVTCIAFLRGAFEQSSRTGRSPGTRRLREQRVRARREKDCENKEEATNHRSLSGSDEAAPKALIIKNKRWAFWFRRACGRTRGGEQIQSGQSRSLSARQRDGSANQLSARWRGRYHRLPVSLRRQR